jgi:hypothetical protein
MSQSQFDVLKRQILLMDLEWKEAMKQQNLKLDTMIASLKSCQSRCHVNNPSEASS